MATTWTLILAGLFVWIAFFKLHLPEFDTNLLLLLGISQGIYVGFKIQENRTPDGQQSGAGGQEPGDAGGQEGANGSGVEQADDKDGGAKGGQNADEGENNNADPAQNGDGGKAKRQTGGEKGSSGDRSVYRSIREMTCAV